MSLRFTEDGTRLEDFIEAAQNTLPLEMERNMQMLRELDRLVDDGMREVSDLEAQYFASATGKLLNRANHGAADPGAASGEPEVLTALEAKRGECMAYAREKVLLADQAHELVEQFIERLDEQLVHFEEQLRATGEFDATTASRGDEVAMMINPEEDQWILGKVLDYRPETGFYHVCDIEEKDKRFMLPEAQIQVLRPDAQERVQKGEDALAIYPDTTSFYPCVITSLPRRGAQSSNNGMCTVQFQDDADETGATPHRQVPLQFVIGVGPPEA